MIQHSAGARGRFAPSPSGPLHAGSVLAALGSWLFARQAGGEWLIRVEDVDRDRCTAAFADHQLHDLAAMGFHSDLPIEWQSRNEARYANALRSLLASDDAFECRCSRADVAAMGGVHHACVNPNRAGPASIRLRVRKGDVVSFTDSLLGTQTQDVHAEVGDFSLRRADGQWTYQFSVVVDDHAQAINQVVRGRDLLDSTARQIVLQQRLGYPQPDYAHLPLILDRYGRKLSKRDEAPHAFDQIAEPLKVLTNAWSSLGQPALPSTEHVDPFLESAQARFDARLIPR